MSNINDEKITFLKAELYQKRIETNALGSSESCKYYKTATFKIATTVFSSRWYEDEECKEHP